ncbi:uncharacterized protein LOC144473286 [Augochlora pura]
MEEHFATMKLGDSDNDAARLTRAFSFSELPSPQRIRVTESYQSGNFPGLVRQYSCEQVFGQPMNARRFTVSEVISCRNSESRNEWQKTISYSDTFKTPNWQLYNSKVIRKPNLVSHKIEKDVEHMEIDSVGPVKEYTSPSDDVQLNTIRNDDPVHVPLENKRDNTVKVKSVNSYEDVKKKLRPLVVSKVKAPVIKRRNMFCNALMCLCILPVVVGIIALLLNPVTYAICDRISWSEKIAVELKEKLHGQTNAVTNIVHALRNDVDRMKTVCLVGGTGIGKSYTTEIILNNFPRKEKIFVFDTAVGHDLYENTRPAIDSFEILIIDNLRMVNLNEFVHLLSKLKQINGTCLTVIAIFNVENVNDQLSREVDLTKSVDEINQAFAGKMIDVSIVPYEPLTESALKMCIADAAAYSNLNLSEDQTNEILEILLLAGTGCKGTYAKVQLIGRG